MEAEKKIRCAIYTRKSTDEGLDKEFNTLEAQRESGENYIKSQRHLGWEIILTHYDDGGFSGGNINRPAFQRLMGDIKDGKVDMIVVYKIDRLTRSLIDFSKVIEIFDKNKCSFVSVTQNFNTADSMGRLTLNMLLSFAQFEREVSSERIRDKVAASKQKGMWMGGNVPLGYNSINKKLIINEDEAPAIRFIFNEYVRRRSELSVMEATNEKGFKTKTMHQKSGKIIGGDSFSHANISYILRNPIYAGKIVHKGKTYDGQHEAIVSPELFDEIKKIKKTNRVNRFAAFKKYKDPLLRGLVNCGCCNAIMVISRSKKSDRVYEYYTSIKAIKEGYSKCSLGSVSTGELDGFIMNLIKEMFQSPLIIQTLARKVQKFNPTVGEREVFDELQKPEEFLKILSDETKRQIVEAFIQKITVYKDKLTIIFTSVALPLLKAERKKDLVCSGDDNQPIQLDLPIRFKRKRGHVVLTIPVDENTSPDNPVYHTLLRAFAWDKKAKKHNLNFDDLARDEKMSRGYVGKVIKMTLLAPDIVEAIMNNQCPDTLRINDIIDEPIPLLWSDQRQKYGFVASQ